MLARNMAGDTSPLQLIVARLRGFTQKHWRGVLVLRDRLRLSEETLHLLLAGGVGIIGGLVHLLYHWLSHLVQWITFGKTGDILTLARAVGPLHRFLVVAGGTLAAGLILHFGLRLLRNPGRGNLLEVVIAGDGRLPFRPALVKALSSAAGISTGASVGREGLIIQLVAAISSALGRLAKWPPYRLRLLVACGAAAGMAAAFDAPIAGAVFAAQIVLGNFSMRLFAPLVFSSVIAAMMSRRFFGIEQWYVVPNFDFTRLSQLPWFVALGVLSGAAGALFLKLMEQSEKWFGKLSLPVYVKIVLAGLVVGDIAILFPEVLGNGYEGTSEMLNQSMAPEQLIILFLGKVLATVVCIGAGMAGGVFTPTLFLGAALGCLMGASLHAIGLGGALPVGAFGLVGMGSVLAATTQSPLLAIIMIFELSLNYSIMPPLMLACVVATLVSRGLHLESVYTLPLRAKGLYWERDNAKPGSSLELTVGDMMQAPVPPLRENTPFREIADRFLASGFNFLPVVNAEGRFTGMVSLHDLKEYLNAGPELDGVIAMDVMRPPPASLTPNQRLSEVLPVLLVSEARNVPVVNNQQEQKLIGALSRHEVLTMFSDAISTSPSSG
ncbi:MAG: chloride channel protein [Verrucomicrobiota bacterium]